MKTPNYVAQGAVMIVLSLAAQAAHAQCTFSSGSTGADGDFIPTNSISMPSTGWSISNNVITVTNSANGVFNFGAIYIETNWIVRFTKNVLNTPVFLLATNNVTIRGSIDVSGSPASATTSGVGGPGGFDGGIPSGGGYDAGVGFGPGGGYVGNVSEPGGGGGFATAGTGALGPSPHVYGLPYGTLDIRPLIGGSGGGGRDYGGSGGAGAILVASSGTITISGSILANPGNTYGGAGGIGSGGAIKLMANVIQGEGILNAQGSSDGGSGRVRLEACALTRVTLTAPPATFGTPGSVFLATNATIRVTSIAGVSVTWPPSGSLNTPDTNLPSAFTNPAPISVSASNISDGTAFNVIVTPVYGTNLIGTGTLVGTYAFSTGGVSMVVYTDRVWRVNALVPYIPRP